MSLYVCQSEQPLTQGQACETWVEYQPLLPPLTLAEGNAIGLAIMLVFAVVAGINRVKSLI